jgi:hypothetical protein
METSHDRVNGGRSRAQRRFLGGTPAATPGGPLRELIGHSHTTFHDQLNVTQVTGQLMGNDSITGIFRSHSDLAHEGSISDHSLIICCGTVLQ